MAQASAKSRLISGNQRQSAIIISEITVNQFKSAILKHLLTKLFDHQPLTHAEAHAAMRQLGEGGANPAETAAFLAVYRMRPITVAELAGFR